MWVQSLGREDPLESEMTTHSSILAGIIPWTEEPGRPHHMGSQSVGHEYAHKHGHHRWKKVNTPKYVEL